MTFPKITIITPSYNQGKYIEQTILSVLDQNYPNLEYLIIDGGSSDDTVDVIKKYQHKLTYWISEKDKGQSDAINKGFKLATGEIINWLNSDDFFAPGSLHKIADAFRRSEVGALTTIVHNFEEGGADWDELTGQCGSNIEYIATSFNNQPGTFFRKAIWDRYFPLPKQLRYTMDQYLWFCFWLEHKVSEFSTEKFTSVFFRRHALSKTSVSLTDITFHSLGKVFFNEHNLIFWSWFNQRVPARAAVLAEYFWDDFQYASNTISFPKHLVVDDNTTELLFQMYLVQLLKEDYRHGFFDRFNRNITYIREDLIPISVRDELAAMNRKAGRPGVMKIYRSLYWGVKNILSRQ